MPELCSESMIVPMNPRREYSGGSTPGSILALKWFSDKKGKVIISFDRRCKYISSQEKPRLGFFYDTSQRKVTHRFSIFDVTDDAGVKEYEKDFLPPWRRELFEETRKPSKRRTWLLIGEIYALDTPKDLIYFGKRRAQSYVYSAVGSELAYSKEETTPDKFIDDIVFRCAVSKTAKFTEDDLELIIWAQIVKNEKAKYLQLQPVPPARGKRRRPDIVVKNSKGEYVVVELKRDKADKSTLDKQLRPYMKLVMSQHGSSKLKGVIVARNASEDLKTELSKKKNDDIKFVPYGFVFKADGIQKALFQ